MKSKTLNECKEIINDKAVSIDIAFAAAEAHFQMMCDYMLIINIIVFIVVVIKCIPFFFANAWNPLWILATIGIFFLEAVAAAYAKDYTYTRKHKEAKEGICNYYLENCEEFIKMEEWQQKQIFKNEIAPLAGLIVSNND